MNKKVNVIPTEGVEETFEILASSITTIAEGFKRLEQTALKRDTIITLLYNAVPGQRVPKKHIEQILDLLPQLKTIYLKK